jgi:hypothetical protein
MILSRMGWRTGELDPGRLDRERRDTQAHDTGGPAKYLPHGKKKLGTPSTLAIQTHQQAGKTPYRLQSPLLEAGLYLYNTWFTKVNGVPTYASNDKYRTSCN